ncbi:flavodoxin/nitric oxide synthase [Ferroglobus placidus DSM 10642]|uniref:Flavodoxin/nitric oxide synthase n=1 Tax=Ferroglobus placidus (strain DSM 10642 / AEDII12DO) TaxID=589924 RepID=D3S055_FERPA|nr:FprA family A-type flavoprotein [Ferroglobus placidus]ADC66118.1 flavodoxin/nitric oxide synthase [Ferroglobus placidus DSM 10642]
MKIADNVYWVGVVDWNVRDFHGYSTMYGTSYNAYLIKDEKVVLIDTVKFGFEEDLLGKIEEITDRIDYVVVNHVEMDHAGALKAVLEKYPEAKIVTNARGKRGLKEAYGIERDVEVVKTGDRLKIGKQELMFIETPMVHWPDSMATYLIEQKILFPNDAFGMHYASSKLIDVELSEEDLEKVFFEAAKYYANIVLPYSQQVRKVLDELKKIELKMICPSHGIIWKDNIEKIVKKYDEWSSGKADRKIVIAYDSMWGYTEKALKKIVEGIEEVGVPYRIYKLRNSDFTELMAEVMQSKGLIVGSSTLNREIFPSVAAFLTYMKGLKPFDKVAAAFGSYGWSGEAVDKIVQVFKELNFEVVGAVKFRFSSDEKSEELKELGRKLAEKL